MRQARPSARSMRKASYLNACGSSARRNASSSVTVIRGAVIIPGDLREIAMAPQPALEAAGTRYAIGDQGFAAIVPFLNQRVAHTKPMAFDGRTPVCANAHLREAGNLLRQLLGLRSGAALGGDVFAQANAQTFLSRHFPSREDDLERPPLADDPRQPHGTSVDQRHTPAAAIDAEIGLVGHHPEVAPQP